MSRWHEVRIYIEIVHYVEIVPLAQQSPVGTSGVFIFGANLDLRRNCTLCRNCPAGTSEFIHFWRQLGSPLGMKIPGDYFSGIPLGFCWRLGINSFWCQFGSSLEFSRWHLGINSVWRQLGLPLGFAIPGDSISGIPPCFPPLGFTLLICSWGITFHTIGGLLLLSFLGELHRSPNYRYPKFPSTQSPTMYIY